ncbi:MAG TPA: PEP-CTERM sorting domain-containing protein [Bryobacteraceae bacterium]|jgi:hypothetical protein|nr:PEP-CTERM sorting domain-containing protein [Bryobacteraceae bacterium]
MKMMIRTVGVLIGFLLSVSSGVAGPVFTFSTLPGTGNISGAPSSVIGWGYSISNLDSTDFLVLTNLDAGTFLHGTPLALFDFPIVGPGSTVSESFDPVALVGLYQLTWDPGAPNGFINSGLFTVTADWYNGDPFNGGTPINGLTGITMSQPYSATVATSVATPEPATASLVLASLAGLMIICKRRNRSSRTGAG